MPWLEQLQSVDWGKGSCMVLAAYALGCFTTGYYVVRWRAGQDLRQLGSGSVGAKNAGRVAGRIGFLLTLTGDFTKGALAVWAAQHFTQSDWLIALAMLSVVAGHIWPCQLGFRGGKGIATSLGGLLIYDWKLAGAFLILFGVSAACLRRTVLPALFCFACLPLASLHWGLEPGRVVALSVLAALILIAHRKNLFEEIPRLMERLHGERRKLEATTGGAPKERGLLQPHTPTWVDSHERHEEPEQIDL